ncbi:MAG: CPBP family intramembrane metalloprotease [Ruminococcaceae bacterium]|nr:CPBP family intramembrane metalloprotease [Oscillospiraceae bacterium]
MLNILKSTPVSVPLLTAVIYVLLSLSGQYLSAENIGTDSVFLVIIIIQIIVFAVPSFIYYGLRGGKLNYPVISGKISGNTVLFTAGAFGVVFFGSLVIKLVFYSNGVEVGNDKGYMDALFAMEDGKFGMFLAYALVPALCEELFFRGIVFCEYKKYGSLNSIIISALYFTMVHFTADGFLIYLFAGFVLGAVTSVCRSVWPAVVIHTLFNSYSLYGSTTFISTTVFNTSPLFVGFVLVVLLLLASVIMLARLELIYSSYSVLYKDEPLQEKSVNHLYIYITPALVVPIAAFIIINALT